MNIDTREFTHCLRVQFYPGWYEEQRIRDVIGYCRKYGFRNVMLFINAEEYNVGHMTPDEADAWIGTLRRAAEAMRAEGLSVSLNPWCSLLHLDRGRTLKPGQNFTTMEDKNGRRNICVACPLDKNWKKYYLEFVRRLVSELRPEVFWVEDDFRLHNHAPLEYGGCFCRLHMAAYRKKLGGTAGHLLPVSTRFEEKG